MQQKLTKAYIQGCNDTWDILESVLKTTKGIGPKTEKLVMRAIRERAEDMKKEG